MDTQDFVKGVDITGLALVTGVDLNNLIELAAPKLDVTDEKGKGQVLVTTDTALDTADIPNASVTTKWKRYLWLRRPHSTATTKNVKAYAWNDNNTSGALLKWSEILANSDTIAALTSLANNALATAEVAELTANAANTTANTANTTANTANTAATNATNQANTAIANAATALSTANTANTNALAAQSAAAAAAAEAVNQHSVSAALLPGAKWQEIRTNEAASSVEWFSRINTYAKYTQVADKGTSLGDSAVGQNIRQLNVEDHDSGNLGSLAAGVVTLAKAGTYYIKAWAIGYNTGAADHQLILQKSDNTVLINGSSQVHGAGAQQNLKSELSGIITATAGMGIQLGHYFGAIETNGLGQAANVHPTAAPTGKEVYAQLEIWLIGA